MSEYYEHIAQEWPLFTRYTGERIVRCRDCKHLYIPQWDEILAAEYGAPPIVCERTGDMDDVEPDGFCAWGERKEVTR